MSQPTTVKIERRDSIGCGSVALFSTLLLVILKVAGVLDWPWLAVFSPVLALVASGVGVLFCFFGCVAAVLVALAGWVIAAVLYDHFEGRKGKP